MTGDRMVPQLLCTSTGSVLGLHALAGLYGLNVANFDGLGHNRADQVTNFGAVLILRSQIQVHVQVSWQVLGTRV